MFQKAAAAFVWEANHNPGVADPSKCGPGAGAAPGGGPQGGGLAHWMSVMAEHMNHDAVHYMWNGGVDVSRIHVFFFADATI